MNATPANKLKSHGLLINWIEKVKDCSHQEQGKPGKAQPEMETPKTHRKFSNWKIRA